MSTEQQERRERLLEAIRKLEEIHGSPDLLEACKKALEELSDWSP